MAWVRDLTLAMASEFRMIGQSALPTDPQANSPAADGERSATDQGTPIQKEIGGRDGPEPTRFGDWEKNGRCIDF
jgi:hypothetical protein